DGEVVQRLPGRAQLRSDGLKRRRVLVVAVDIAQKAAQPVEGRGIEPAVLLEAVLGASPELFKIPAGLRHADDRHVEVTGLHHRLQRGKDLLVREVAGRAEEGEGIGSDVDVAHMRPRIYARFSRWPPNSNRMAESSLSAKSASPRELKRS